MSPYSIIRVDVARGTVLNVVLYGPYRSWQEGSAKLRKLMELWPHYLDHPVSPRVHHADFYLTTYSPESHLNPSGKHCKSLRQVGYLLGAASPLKAVQRRKLKTELHAHKVEVCPEE